MIDRLFGGLGSADFNSRPFTDIEKAVFKKIINWILNAFPEAWENIIRVRPLLRDIESNPQFTQIVPGNDMVILITLVSKIGNSEGLINICIPYIMIEPIVNRLNAQQWSFTKTRQEQAARHINILRNRIKRTHWIFMLN